MKSFWRTSFGLVLALAMFAGTAKAEAKADTSLDGEVAHYLENTTGMNGAPADFRVFWKNGLHMASGDGNFTVHIRGRMFFDMDWADSDSPDLASDEDVAVNHVGFSAARLGAAGTFYKNGLFKIEIGFESGSASFKDVYLGLKNLGGGKLLMGHFKRPFGLNELTSSRFVTFTSRAPSSDAFAPGRDSGIMWGRNFMESERIHFAIGTFFDTNSQGQASGQGGWGFTLRVAGLAMENADKDMILSIGLSFMWQNLRQNGQEVEYGAGSGSSLADDILGVTVAAEDEIRYAVEIAFKMKALHVQAEFFWATPTAVSGDDPTFSGFYAQVGYFITGESRTFSKKGMIWKRTSPKANFWTGDGGRGAMEVAVRFDSVDLEDSGYDGGEQDQISVAFNWYWNPNARMMVAWYINDLKGGGDDATLNVLVIRWQFDF
jgi:phosphate-selective porin OprO/OprP